jgi:hypothetical protein
MTATYTPSLRLTLQGDGDNPNTWGDVTNDQVIELIEAGVCGVAPITITGTSNIDISATTENGAPDTARNMVLQLVGTLGANIQLIVPAVPKIYIVDCLWSGAYTVTMKAIGGSSTVVLNTGQKVVVYISGTTIAEVATSTPIGALLASNNLSDLTSISTALTNLGIGTMGTQNANNVNITGGSISGVTGLSAVTSVAGRTGAVVLSNTDISGLGGAATLNPGTSANNLVQLNGSGQIPASLNPVAAWVNFNGSNGTINGSSNITSVTRNSTGHYTVVMTSALADTHYAVTATSNSSPTVSACCEDSGVARTTNTFGISVWNPSGFLDPGIVSVVVIGT